MLNRLFITYPWVDNMQKISGLPQLLLEKAPGSVLKAGSESGPLKVIKGPMIEGERRRASKGIRADFGSSENGAPVC